MKYEILKGLPYPLGANYDGNGVNFALFSAHATRVQLCLFNALGNAEHKIDLPYYTDEVFHAYITGIKPGQLYGYRVYGPYDPQEGMRFNPHKLLIDPYAKQVTGPFIAHNSQLGYNPDSPLEDLSFSRVNSAPFTPKCVVVSDDFNWEEIQKPKTPWDEEIIYEMHLKGFTAQDKEIDKAIRGTCAGLSTKKAISYLKSLGISTIELLPVAGFMTNGFLLDKGLTNYWGYDPITFMAPHAPYLSDGSLDEFKRMIRLYHEAGIEVILDVVYNHTGEGNQKGQTLCYRGIDNSVYYRLNKENKRFYEDTTGCGASFNIEHPRVLQLVMDSLRYWADKIQIDGFRFDLATTLARDEHNNYTTHSDFLSTVQQDPTLQRLKLIAEPWDLGWGGYQVGAFRPGWAEWNDKFRDTLRAFFKGDEGKASEFAERFTGSADTYAHKGRKPWASINFITAHDGFRLYDLVSYNQKHNQKNCENNQDGNNHNLSFNSGEEGESYNPLVIENRRLRTKAMMASLLLSFGTPMIRAGDEFLQTSYGNNNTYAQDNYLSWLNWDISPLGKEMLTLVKKLIKIRKKYSTQIETTDFDGLKFCTWYTPNGEKMQQEDWQYFVRAISFVNTRKNNKLFFLFNAFTEDIIWHFPSDYPKKWQLILDTSGKLKDYSEDSFLLPAWSVCLFEQGVNRD